MIGFFVLAGLFLVRKYRREHPQKEVAMPPPTYEFGRDDPKFLVSDYRSNRRTGGYGPSELATKREPVELSSERF
jgi:hypothetical protein